MANNQPNTTPESDEIDLGQLLQLVNKGIFRIGNFLLRVFLFLKRNSVKLIGLIAIGVGISYGLKALVAEKLKTDVIVKPNFESTNYLYDVIEEIKVNINTRDEAFLSSLNISAQELKGFDIEVMPIEDEESNNEDALKDEMQYLEVLQNFKDESFVIDIIRSELSQKSVIQHKISFFYKDQNTGPSIVGKLMEYINTNDYFNGLKNVYTENAKSRIDKNQDLIEQIDGLVANYSKALLADKSTTDASMVYMEKDNSLNIPSLLNLKNTLIKEIEAKKLELTEQTSALSIINLGKTHKVKKAFFNQRIVLIPSLLVLGFFVLSFLQYLNRKSQELQ